MDDEEERLARRHRASRETKLDKHIALVGFMGAGKSSIGGRLAERLGRPFYDSDASIEEQTGHTVQELFRMGEPEFRALEASAVRAIVAGPPAVIALGGGALELEETRELLASSSFVVHLHLSWPEVRSVLPALSADRPLLQQPLADIHRLYLDRQKTYRSADVRIDAPRDVGQAVERVLAALKR
jgi:shikimate kinase